MCLLMSWSLCSIRSGAPRPVTRGWPVIRETPCAVSIRLDKLANGNAIANFLRSETAIVRSLHRKGHLLLLGSALAGRYDAD